MNNIKKTAKSTKQFVSKHRVAIAVVTTATLCLAINKRAMREHDLFLEEKGLLEEFYTPEDSYEI